MHSGLNDVSLVIATFNEEESLDFVLNEIKDFNFLEIIIVDNNSSDKTSEIAKKYNTKFIIQNQKGWGAAVIEGFQEAKGKYITYIDGDGSYNPKSILEMYELRDEYDFVCGSRYKFNNQSEDDTFIRAIGNKLFTLITKYFLKLNLSDSLFFFPLIKNKDFKQINPKSTNFGLCIEMPLLLAKKNLNYTDILSLERKRVGGESKVNALRDGLKILFEIFRMLIKY